MTVKFNKQDVAQVYSSLIELESFMYKTTKQIENKIDDMNWNDDLRNRFNKSMDKYTADGNILANKVNKVTEVFEGKLKDIDELDNILGLSLSMLETASSNNKPSNTTDTNGNETIEKVPFNFDSFELELTGANSKHSISNDDTLANLLELKLPDIDISISEMIHGLENTQSTIKYERDGLIEYGNDDFNLVLHPAVSIAWLEDSNKETIMELGINKEGIINDKDKLIKVLSTAGIALKQ